ncbi:hypothetical protein ASPZODRAFT_18137 [Penicilliopsis zonata CBS 506.65]|uniref:Uncharacterized protein n=1 Tax=Penicilliopsis zonata CBS 506.65 TaxID=1073090 RepID=A0A1L9SBK8_9EURO|nr:hypothetical protein ASPZODRAFT_18137 [Penicilliopsis zonata CBS 506.65]OJJ44561.1 hypothetical protein ASPZODRAFT_18137 [Penicilliopsis zonata CBS 506.65]
MSKRVIDPRSMHPRPARPVRPAQGQVDIRQTKEYKAAARKWTSVIVALPIVFVTSYMLFERTYGSKSQKHLQER